MLTSYKTIFVNKKLLTDSIYFFTFKLIDPPEINFVPGQYLILRVEGKPRLYSIASSNTEKNQLEFIIEIFPGGLASTYLSNLKENDEVNFQGPAGQFKLKENDKQKIFLVTGTGIAPVRSMLISNIKNQKYYIFWGLKTYNDTYLFEEFKQFNNLTICLSREKNLDVIPESNRQYFDLGHVDQCMEKILNSKFLILNSEFYLCGGRDIVESLRKNLLAKSVMPENIIFEKF